MTAPQERPVAGDGLDREAVRRHIEELTAERDAASAEAENLTAGMAARNRATSRNAQGCLGNYAKPLLDALDAAEAQRDELRRHLTSESASVPRSALVQVGWFHGDGVNVTAFRPSREGEPAHPEEWSPVYVLRTEGGAS